MLREEQSQAEAANMAYVSSTVSLRSFYKAAAQKGKTLETEAEKFKVYVIRAQTQAQGLAGIITTHSSVTVSPLSLTSARVTHILYTHAHVHTHPICILIATSIARSQTPSVTFP